MADLAWLMLPLMLPGMALCFFALTGTPIIRITHNHYDKKD